MRKRIKVLFLIFFVITFALLQIMYIYAVCNDHKMLLETFGEGGSDYDTCMRKLKAKKLLAHTARAIDFCIKLCAALGVGLVFFKLLSWVELLGASFAVAAAVSIIEIVFEIAFSRTNYPMLFKSELVKLVWTGGLRLCFMIYWRSFILYSVASFLNKCRKRFKRKENSRA